MPAFEDVKKSGTSECPNEGRDPIFDEFCADRETIAALGVTDVELRELSRASLLGTLTSTDDLLFMLKQIRKAVTPAEPPLNEQSISDVVAMTETMRRAALAKLNESDLLKARSRSRAAWRRVKMMLNRRNHPSPSYRTD
jgi:hypothetical protein